MTEATMNDRLTRIETRAEEYVKRSEIAPTLVRIETKLDNLKWILGVIVAIMVAITTGVIVGSIMFAIQGYSMG